MAFIRASQGGGGGSASGVNGFFVIDRADGAYLYSMSGGDIAIQGPPYYSISTNYFELTRTNNGDTVNVTFKKTGRIKTMDILGNIAETSVVANETAAYPGMTSGALYYFIFALWYVET